MTTSEKQVLGVVATGLQVVFSSVLAKKGKSGMGKMGYFILGMEISGLVLTGAYYGGIAVVKKIKSKKQKKEVSK